MIFLAQISTNVRVGDPALRLPDWSCFRIFPDTPDVSVAGSEVTMGALDEILVGIFIFVVGLLITKYISKTIGLVLLVVAIAAAIFFRDPAMDWVHSCDSRLQGIASAGTVMYQADVGSTFAAWLSPGPGRDKPRPIGSWRGTSS